jgi:hypothetical protein
MQHSRHMAFLESLSSAVGFLRIIGGLFFSTSLMAFAQSGNSADD